jgi:hypothetical protein
MLSEIVLSFTYKPFMLSVTYKPFMLSVIMLSVIMLGVIMLSVVAFTAARGHFQLQMIPFPFSRTQFARLVNFTASRQKVWLEQPKPTRYSATLKKKLTVFCSFNQGIYRKNKCLGVAVRWDWCQNCLNHSDSVLPFL